MFVHLGPTGKREAPRLTSHSDPAFGWRLPSVREQIPDLAVHHSLSFPYLKQLKLPLLYTRVFAFLAILPQAHDLLPLVRGALP